MPRILFLILLCCVPLQAQEISQTNTDSLYFRALKEYKKANFNSSIRYTSRGLELAPDYHDIRVLRIRSYWGIKQHEKAKKDLDYLLKEAPDYPNVKKLALQQLNLFSSPDHSLAFLQELKEIYPSDLDLEVKMASVLFEHNQTTRARSTAKELLARSDLSGAQRYQLQVILKQSAQDEVAVGYAYMDFSSEYVQSDSWHSFSLEYQHNFNKTSVIGRTRYSDRGYDNGLLYEIEAYPVFSDQWYAYTGLAFSRHRIFPDWRTHLSVFYNFASSLEAEAGFRALWYNGQNFNTAILGLTAYSGRFYLNARSFLGPKKKGRLVENYQVNVRYYFRNVDDYLFLRLGTGISPDESLLDHQIQQIPTLEAWYGNFGLNKALGIHHIFQISSGFVFEEMATSQTGSQWMASALYRYRF